MSTSDGKVRFQTAVRHKHKMHGVKDPDNWWWQLQGKHYVPIIRFQDPKSRYENKSMLQVELKTVKGTVVKCEGLGSVIAEPGYEFTQVRLPGQRWRKI